MSVDLSAHTYPAGWDADNVDIIGQFDWAESDGGDKAMLAWRWCPVCGQRLLNVHEAVIFEPRCSGCNRPFEACPCACVECAKDSDA